MSYLYTLNINENLNPQDFKNLMSYVSDEKKDRISRFRRFEDSQRSLLGDILAKYAICKKHNINYSDIIFCFTEYNKPLLKVPSGTYFNISHSGNWLLCGIDDNPIGVDVECIKPIDMNIAKRFFSEYEYNALINQPEDTRLNYFYMLWTLKESYIKADGKGLSIPLDSFSMEIYDTKIIMKNTIESAEHYFYQFFPDSSSVSAVCILNSKPPETLSFNTASFLQELVAVLNQ